jgi:hypothetical protein
MEASSLCWLSVQHSILYVKIDKCELCRQVNLSLLLTKLLTWRTAENYLNFLNVSIFINKMNVIYTCLVRVFLRINVNESYTQSI